MDWSPIERQIAGNVQALRVRDAIAGLEGPATVWLVVPSPTTVAHLVRLWGDRFGASREISFRLLGSLSPGARPEQARISIREEDGQSELGLEEGLLLTTAVTGVPRQGPLPLLRLSRADRVDWVLALDADDERLVRVPVSASSPLQPSTSEGPLP
jgi:hypothetical protein